MGCMTQTSHSGASLSTSLDLFNSQMDMYLSQHKTHLARIESLISRAQGVSALIQNILDIRTGESNSRINSAVHDITEQGIQENKLIKRLTHQSTQDTRVMKVIALISAIFLPATFVATLFGSNFFGFKSEDGRNFLAVAENVWIYIVTAVAMSSLAVAAWFLWLRRNRAVSTTSAGLDIEVLI